MKNEFKPNSDYKVEIMENFYKVAMARAEKAEAKVVALTNALEIAEEALKCIGPDQPNNGMWQAIKARRALEAVAKAKGEG